MKIGDIIDRMAEVREELRELAQKERELREEFTELEAQLISRMDETGLVQCAGGQASAILTETAVPVVDDWDALHEYIKENDALYLLHRRVNIGAFKELVDMEGPPPGTRQVIKRTISLRRKSNGQ